MSSQNKNPRVFTKIVRWLPGTLLVLVMVAALAMLAMPSKKSQAAPFAACDTNGILFQYPGGVDTQVHLIDMVTGGDTQPAGTPIANRTINAIGYNVLDNHIYGWDHTQNTLVRIHDDYTAESLTVTGFVPPPLVSDDIIIGDVDENGHFWFINGAGNEWVQIDLTTTPTPTFIDSGSAAGITGTAGADWAYVPGGAGLYRIMNESGTGHLWVFDRAGKTWSDLGALTDIPAADLTMGAFYADANGFLYGASNTNGSIWRVDVGAVTATLFATGPASGSNDGARCAEAIIPIDFGDAPSAYDTLLADGGPRHGVAGFNEANSTAPLMLGKKVDIETDGFPGAEANGDDHDHVGTPFVDDEDGVTHIVATPGTPTALSVPVTVTNTSSSSATLAGWIDLNANNTFETGERVLASVPANSGTAVYELNFPTTTFTTDSMARFRVFEGAVADPQPIGSVAGGEIEDVLVQVGTYEVVKSSDPTDGSTVVPGDTITYTLSVNNTGLTDLIDLTLHDDLSNVLDDATIAGTPVVEPASAGTATVDNDALQFIFTGDILTGQSVTITYSVQVKDPDTLGDHVLRNMVIAAHSNCHPDINGQTVTVSDPNCSTEHPIDASLANTGSSIGLPLSLAAGLVGTAGAALYFGRKRFGRWNT